jgi:7,8-dihydroneopterin aldolase/epimerase/oxygenase
MMANIAIVDLEVRYCIGVSEAERARAQRLLLTIEMETDIAAASREDHLEHTINYQNVADDLLRFGDGRNWRLLETLVADVADLVLSKYKPRSVRVEAKKYVIPQARHVAVSTAKTTALEGEPEDE